MRSNEFQIYFLAAQIISDEIDALFLQLNQNETTDFRWIYAYCTSNCYVTIRPSNTTLKNCVFWFSNGLQSAIFKLVASLIMLIVVAFFLLPNRSGKYGQRR